MNKSNKLINENKCIYDIMIENYTKEWFSMNSNLQNPNWETPKYSKKQIDKAGKIIADVFTNQIQI